MAIGTCAKQLPLLWPDHREGDRSQETRLNHLGHLFVEFDTVSNRLIAARRRRKAA